MGWEMRRGRLYYYRKRRDGGRVVSEYIGTAALAPLIERMERKRRADDTQITPAEEAERERAAAAADALQEFCDLTDALMRAHLHAVGYRQHHRGEWRKRRG